MAPIHHQPSVTDMKTKFRVIECVLSGPSVKKSTVKSNLSEDKARAMADKLNRKLDHSDEIRNYHVEPV